MAEPTTRSGVERIAYTVPEFCFRNSISRPTYHRLRAQGLGPKEMRLGLNAIRITAEAERDWQRRMQEPRTDLEKRRGQEQQARQQEAVNLKNEPGRRCRSASPGSFTALVRNAANVRTSHSIGRDASGEQPSRLEILR